VGCNKSLGGIKLSKPESSEEKIPNLESEVEKIINDLEEIAKKLEMPMYELIPIMILREIVILNRQLKYIHDHLDMIEERVRKAKSP
jgi:uncharacterized Rmd1/YagE family protein